MLNRILIYILSSFALIISCKKNDAEHWISFENENVQILMISKSDTLILENLRFEVTWDKQLIPNKKLGYLGGIKRMGIYKNDSLVNTFENIEDAVGLGEINITFYDFNMDGELDFSLPIDMGKNRWNEYFIYNSEMNKFRHQTSWDYLRLQKINPNKKWILSQPDGFDPRKIYFVSGDTLIYLKDMK